MTWEVPDKLPADQLDALHILRDTTRGGIDLTTQADVPEISTSSSLTNKDLRNLTGTFYATMRPPAEPGDQTVPMHSADAQSRSGQFKGIFRQTGYEHQDSYQDKDAVASTLYSIVSIAQEMKWKS